MNLETLATERRTPEAKARQKFRPEQLSQIGCTSRQTVEAILVEAERAKAEEAVQLALYGEVSHEQPMAEDRQAALNAIRPSVRDSITMYQNQLHLMPDGNAYTRQYLADYGCWSPDMQKLMSADELQTRMARAFKHENILDTLTRLGNHAFFGLDTEGSILVANTRLVKPGVPYAELCDELAEPGNPFELFPRGYSVEAGMFDKFMGPKGLERAAGNMSEFWLDSTGVQQPRTRSVHAREQGSEHTRRPEGNMKIGARYLLRIKAE